MAIFRLSSNSISRGKGSSAVASAAYRSAEKLHHETENKDFDYSRKQSVDYTEIMLPEKANAKYQDRETLWNKVEQAEKRVNSEFAKEYQLALPKELEKEEMISLVRDFAKDNFLDKGLAVDMCFHKLDSENPHVHLMTTTRSFDENGELGKKERFFKDKAFLVNLRKDWELSVNKTLEEKGIDERITSESYAERGIDLQGINTNLKGKAGQFDLEVQRTARSLKLLENPSMIADILTDKNATFSENQLNTFLNKNVLDEHRLEVLEGLAKSENLITVNEQKGIYTSTSYLVSQQKLVENVGKLNIADETKAVSQKNIDDIAERMTLTDKQKEAVIYATSHDSNVKNIEGYAGSGKSYTIKAVKEVFEQSGLECRGVALSGIVADNLGKDAGIEDSRTVASFLYRIENDMDKVTDKTVLFVDESSLIGVKDYQKLTDIVADAGGKLINVGDDNQLQAIQAGNATKLIKEHSSHFTLDEIRRQQDLGDREASLNLSIGKQKEALEHYLEKGAITAHQDKSQMLNDMTMKYVQSVDNEKTNIIMAFRRADVAEINEHIHDTMKSLGVLGESVEIAGKEYSEGDRFIFLKNDNDLSVKNGTTGTIERVTQDGEMQIKTDDNRTINFNANEYEDFSHAYAVTIHKSQGVTVDEAQVYLDSMADSHLALVGCTRHKENLDIHITQYHEDINPQGFKSFDEFVQTCEQTREKSYIENIDDLLRENILNKNPEILTKIEEERRLEIKEKAYEELSRFENYEVKKETYNEQIREYDREIKDIKQDIAEREMLKEQELEKTQEAREEKELVMSFERTK